MSQSNLYDSPVVQTPTIEQLRKCAAKLGLDNTTESELQDYQGFIEGGLAGYQVLDKYPDCCPVVKYPRTPGYRPLPDDNPYNAWYYKTDIKGAPSGPLAGKTVAIKDNIAVAGVPMMNGSKLLEGYMPEFDATVVTRILDAGGTIAGKSNCEDLCFSGSGFTCSKGPVLNFYDTTRMSGGSSSGSAVLVAAGEVDMAIGTDQGCSVRLPASWNGLVGLKPTWGLVPYTGAASIEPTVDHIGPITKTVHDCAVLLQVLAGYDGLDPRQPGPSLTVPNYTKNLTEPISGIKVGILKEGFQDCEPDVEKLVKEAANALTSVGASVEEVSIPMHLDGPAIWGVICTEGAYHTMVDAAGIAFGVKGFQPTSMIERLKMAVKTKPNDLPHTVKYVSLMGAYMKEKYFNRFYAKATNVNRLLTQAYDEVLQKYDVIIMPTVRFKPPKIPKKGTAAKEYLPAALNMTANTSPGDSTGHPSLSINVGLSEGLPVGMVIGGKKWDESTILRVAYAYEKIRDAK